MTSVAEVDTLNSNESSVTIISPSGDNTTQTIPVDTLADAINILDPYIFINYDSEYLEYTNLTNTSETIQIPTYLPFDSYSYTNTPASLNSVFIANVTTKRRIELEKIQSEQIQLAAQVKTNVQITYKALPLNYYANFMKFWSDYAPENKGRFVVYKEEYIVGYDITGAEVTTIDVELQYEPLIQNELDFSNKLSISNLNKVKYTNNPYIGEDGRTYIGRGYPGYWFNRIPIILKDFTGKFEDKEITLNAFGGISDADVIEIYAYTINKTFYDVQRILGVDRWNYLVDNHPEWLITLLEQQLFIVNSNEYAPGIIGNPQLLYDMGLIDSPYNFNRNDLKTSFKPKPEKIGQELSNQIFNILNHSETNNPNRDIALKQLMYDKSGAYYDKATSFTERPLK